MKSEYGTVVSAVTDLQDQFDVDAKAKIEELLEGSQDINKRGLVVGLIARGLAAIGFDKDQLTRTLEAVDPTQTK